MAKLTADESFQTYLKIKAIAEVTADDDLWHWREDFFLDINDYDMWDEGQPDVPYYYPWTATVTADLARFGIRRKGTEIRYGGELVELSGTTVLFGGKAVGELR